MPFPSDTDPDTEVEALLDRRVRAPDHRPAAHRQRELHVAGGDAGRWARCSPTSTPRATPASATTAATPSSTTSRHWRSSASRTLFGAEHANVQPHSRRQRQHVRLPGAARGRRHRARAQPRPRRPPHARLTGQRQRHATITSSPYQVTPGDERIDMDQVRDLALEHRPKMIVAGTTSYPRRLDPEPFQAIADEVGALLPVRRRPPRRPHRRWRPSQSGAVRRRRHVHHPQDAARAARRVHPVHAPSTPRPSTRPCSPAGRAARSSTSSPARPSRSARRPTRASRSTPTRSWRTPAALAEALAQRGLPPGVGRHRQPPDGGRPAPVRRRADRQGGPDGARRGRDHAQQEHHARRPAQPVRHERRAHRHAVGHHPGHERGRDGARSPG